MTFSWTHPELTPALPVLLVGLGAWYLEATHRCDPAPSRRQRQAFCGGLLALLVAIGWPLGVLARSTSLSALVLQRELLALVAAPLLLYSVPREIGVRMSRPAPVDWVLVKVSEPVPALVVTTLLLGVTAMPFSVGAISSHVWIRALVDLGVFVAGVVLWIPVIRRIPGVRELTPVGTAGYLMAQSIAPTFLSFAWILWPHTLYPTLHGQHAALAVAPLMDQRIAGYLAKLGTFGIIWPVAFRYFSRAVDSVEPHATDIDWSDMERQLERVERQERKASRNPAP